MTRRTRPIPVYLTASLMGTLLVSACAEPLDFDLRGKMGGSVDTSQAARSATTARPRPDNRGIISYPNYQVAVARRGDTITDVAGRVGLPASELARFNGIELKDPLRAGEVIALPRRVAEPSPATGARTTGPIRPTADVDVTTLAAGAIERAAPTPARVADVSGVEPVRHKVSRGETAFTIARLYNVSPRSLAEWNGLDSDFTLREGQFLLIPVAAAPARVAAPDARVIEPGAGSPTPVPPSAARPLPAETLPPANTAQQVEEKPEPVADIGQASPAASNAAMVMPVSGSIIREYAKGRNEGIDISAPAGTAVKAAASGQVAAVTKNTENITIVVIKHPDDVLSIYTHLDNLSIKKGDAVSRGQSIGKVRAGSPSFLHFEVRKGFDSVDPMGYLQ